MTKRTVTTIICLLTILSPFFSAHADSDAPHNSGSNISCSSCHGDAILSSPFWGDSPDDNTYNNFCLLNCHNAAIGPYTDTSAPRVLSHSSQTTSNQYGEWSISCIECHNPHLQDQKTWLSTNSAELYLASGKTSLPAPVYDQATNSSTLNYSVINYKAGWSAAALTAKSSTWRRAILLPNTKKLGFSFNVIAIDAPTVGTIRVAGDASAAFAYVTPPTNFAIIYGQLISRTITGANVTVSFLDKTGKNSFAFDESGTGTDPTPTGICQVCHTQTAHWRKDGTLSAVGIHAPFNGANCMLCHSHADGFKASFPDHGSTGLGHVADAGNCVSCHVGPDPVINTHQGKCALCHLADLSLQPGLSRGDCGHCHAAYVVNFEIGHQHEDHASVVATTDATPTQNCGGCHTGNPITDAQNHNNHCTDCHTDMVANGSLRSGTLGNATVHTIGEESGCADCHGGDYFAKHTHAHTVSQGAGDTSQNSGAACSTCHNANGNGLASWEAILVEHNSDCTLCHNSLRDTSKSGVNAIGVTIQEIIAANGATTCASCHRDQIDIIAEDAGHGIDHQGEGRVVGADQCTGCHDQGGVDANTHYLSVIHHNCGTCHVAVGGGGPLHDYSGSGSSIGEAVNYETINGGHGGSCVVCHTGYAANFATAHQHASHVTLTGIAKCTSCHGGEVIAEVHQATCTNCHLDLAGDGRLQGGGNGYGTAATHTIGVDSSCADCHPAYDASFQGGHQHEDHDALSATTNATPTLNCGGCHAGDLITAAATHQSHCTDCHDDADADGSLVAGTVGDATEHTIGVPSGCADCHGADYFPSHTHAHTVSQGVLDISQNNPEGACSTCHNDSGNGLATWADILVEHKSDCPLCHDVSRDTSANGFNSISATVQGVIAANGATTCGSCHRDQVNSTSTDAYHGIDHQGAGKVMGSLQCTGCHDQDGNNSNAQLITQIHGSCGTCHVAGGGGGSLHDYSAGGSHIGEAVNYEAINDGHGGSCVDCHTGYASNFAEAHQQESHDTLAGIAKCTSCHGGDMVSVVHQANCGDCHANTLTDGSLRHGANGYGTAGTHWMGQISTCADCHPDYNASFQTGHQHEDHNLLTATADATPTKNCGGCHVGNLITTTHLSHCNDCHVEADSDGTLRAGSLGTATVHTIGVASACADCHNATYFPGHTHVHTVTMDAGDLSQNSSAACSTCHNDAGASLSTWAAIFIEHQSDCTLCHDAGRDTSVSGLYSIAATIQGVIAAGGATTCASCHRDQIDAIAHADAMHGIDHQAAGKVTGSAQCTGCHDQEGKENNAQFITIIHGSCGTCHVAVGGGGPLHDYAAVGSSPMGDDVNYEAINGGQGGSCVDCHAAYATDFAGGHKHEAHDTLTGIATCVSCHQTEIISGVHQGSCTDCHTDAATDGRLRAGANGSGTAATHTIGQPSTCADCHPAHAANFQNGHQPADHAFLVATDDPLPTLNCGGCHTGNLISGADTHLSACGDCHADVDNDGSLVSGSRGDATVHTLGIESECADCHGATYFANHTHIHSVTKGVAEQSQHIAADCSSCHDDNGNGLALWIDILAEHQNDCALCHDATRNTSQSGLNSNGSTIQSVIAAHGAATCATCHRDQINAISADATHGIDHLGAGKVTGSALCNNCHDPDGKGSNPQYLIAIHGACSTCHVAVRGGGPLHDYSDGGSTIGQAVNYETINGGGGGSCVTCHAAYFAGHAHDHATQVQANVAQTPVTANCGGCHTATAAPFIGSGEVHASNGCATCHDLGGNGGLIAPAVAGGGECISCHTTYFSGHDHGASGGTIDHSVVFNGATDLSQSDSQPCANCHSVADWPQILTTHHDSCASCHDASRDINPTAPTGTLVATVIANANHGQVNCLGCHQNKSAPNGHGNVDHVTGGILVDTPFCCGCHAASDPMAVHVNKCSSCHTSPPSLQLAANRPLVEAIVRGADCVGCHGAGFFTGPHGHDHSATVTGTALCLNCHSGDIITAVHGNGCFLCHAAADGARRVGGNGNGDATVNGGTGGSCAQCHAGYFSSHDHDHATQVKKNVALTPVTATCSGCHTATTSPFITNGEVHAADGCATCHNIAANGALIAPAVAGGGECVICHTLSFNGHDHGTTGGLVDHTVSINGGSDLGQADAEPCSVCHAVQNWPDILTIHQGNCALCHNAGRDINPITPTGTLVTMVIADADQAAVHCLACHQDKAAPNGHGNVDHLSTNHLLDTPFCCGCHGVGDPMAVHQGKCGSCHTSPPLLQLAADRPLVEAISNGATCTGCHGVNFFTGPHGHDHAATVTGTPMCQYCHGGAIITTVHNNSCYLCHSSTNGARIIGASGHGDATVNGGNGGSCAQCHAGYFNSHTHDHATQVKKNVALTPVTANCCGCHTATTPPFVGAGEVHGATGCATCHQTAVDGVLVAPAVSGGGECISCHTTHFSGHDHGAVGGSVEHTVAIAPATDLGQVDGLPCSACHAVADWPEILATHPGGCAICHDAVRDVNPAVPSGTTVQFVITNFAGTVHCLDCHQDRGNAGAHGAPDHAAIILDAASCVAVCHGAGNPMAVHNSRCTHCHTAPPALQPPANRPRVTAITSGATCTGCHTAYFNSHTHDHGGTVTATALCVNCHSGAIITEVHTACASCHDPANGARRVGDNDHGDATVNGGGGGTCQQCHAAYFASHTHDHATQVKKNVALTPLTVNCVGCHAATTPPFIATGEVHGVSGCATCHDLAANGGLISPAVAGGGECVSCHTLSFNGHDHGADGGSIDHTVQINGVSDRSQADAQPCSSCHQVGDWANILSLHQACATCHNASRDINPAAPTGTMVGMVIAGANHAPVRCLECHQDKSAPNTHGSVDHVAGNQLKDTTFCVGCHGAGDPLAVHQSKCSSCHTSPPSLQLAADRPLVAAMTPGADCVGCHGANFFIGPHGHNHAATVTGTALCLNCHGGNTISAVHNSDCFLCHSSANGARINGADGHGDATVNGGAGGSCAHCHAGYFSSHDHDHATQVTTNVDQTPLTANCGGCHAASTAPFIASGEVHSGNGCATCHDLTANGGLIAPAVAGGGECILCHSGYFSGHDHGVSAGSVNHTVAINLGSDLGQTDSEPCSTCHAVQTWSAILTLHGVCATCHDATRDINPATPTGTLVQTVIANADQAQVNCLACHQDKGVANTHGHGDHYSGGVGALRDTPFCVACHGAGDPLAAHGGKCGSCHTAPPELQLPANRPLVVDMTAGADCTGCHGANFFTGPHGHDHTLTVTATPLCVNCHTGNTISAVHQNSCFLCHSNANGARIVGVGGHGDATVNMGNGGACLLCHGAYFNGHSHDHATQVKQNVALTPATAHCGGCHAATASPFVGNGEVHADSGCATCHDLAGNGTLIAPAVAGGGECVSCHTSHFSGHDHGSDGGTVDHTVEFNAGSDLGQADSSPCSDCHGVATWSDILTTHHNSCAFCHNATRDINPVAPTGTLVQSVIANANHTPVYCLNCHPNKSAPNVHGNVDHVATGHLLDTPFCVACHGAGDPMAVHASKCSSCHTSPPLLQLAADRPLVEAISNGATCTGCHGANFFTGLHGHDHAITVTGTPLCLNCHTGAIITTVHNNSCYLCHSSASGARIAGGSGHGDASVNGGNGGSCGQCHAGYFNSHTHDHSDQVKENVALTPATANCVGCHLATTSPFVGAGQVHGATGCATCHNLAGNGALIAPAVSGGGECISCHTTHFSGHDHGAVGGSVEHTVAIAPATDLGQVDGLPCSACHAVADWPEILATHPGGCATCHDAVRDVNPAVPSGTTVQFVITNFAGTVHCLDCHQDRGSAGAHGAPDHAAIILDAASCVAVCHGAGNPMAVHNSRCTHCHTAPPALQPPANRPQVTAITNGATCTGCHTAYFNSHSHGHAGSVTATALCVNCHSGAIITEVHTACASCHDPANGARRAGVNGHGDATVNGGGGGSCAQCHAAYFSGHTHNHATTVKVNSVTTPAIANCVSSGCHSATTPPFAGGGEVHQGNGCLTCHAADTGARIGSAAGRSGECNECHTTYFAGHDHGAAGGVVNHTVATDGSDLGQANSQPCASCHTVADWPQILAAHLGDCGLCHNATRDINEGLPTGTTIPQVIALGANPTTCRACHDDKKSPASHMNHVSHGFVTVAASCVTQVCHSGASSEPVLETHGGICAACHASPNGGDYTLKAGSSAEGHGGATPGSPNTCTTCHALDFTGIHTPLGPSHTISSNTGCDQCHGALATWTAIKGVHGTCVTCHESGRAEVTAAINDGNADTCYECHAPHNPTHLVTTAAGCDSCHGTLATWASIEAVHQPTTGDGCVTCHASQRAEVQAVISANAAVTCVACHGAHDLQSDHADLSSASFCTDCHTLSEATMTGINQLHDRASTPALSSCDTCHAATRQTGTDTGITVPQVIKASGAKSCLNCHVDLLVNHPGGYGNHAGVRFSPQCQFCHSGSSIVDDIHQGHCTDCHTTAPTLKPDVTSGDCMHCHGTHHGPTHTKLIGTPSCNACHPDTTYDEIALLHFDDCSLCHKSTDATVVQAIADGIAAKVSDGAAIQCTNCHNFAHHTDAHAQKGDCAYCHADPRPGWVGTYNTPLPSPLPYQLACRECHVEKTGTGLVVYRNEYYANAANPLNSTITFPSGTRSATIAGAATVHKTVVHTIASTSNQKINVYNYGACMACHNVRQLHHAKPRGGEYPLPDPTNVATFPYDTLRNAPGRGIFNEFKADIRLSYQWLKNKTRSAAAYDRGYYFMKLVNQGTQPWYWGALPHLTVSIPCIDAVNDPDNLCTAGGSLSVPYFANLATPGPFPEILEFTRAVWNEDGNDELTVHVSNQYLQNATLTLTYGDQLVAQPMTWNDSGSRWELTVTGLTYWDTVSVTSDIGGGQTETKAHYVADMTRDITAVVVDHTHVKLDGAECAQCHSANNVTEHVVVRGKTCEGCHTSTEPTVVAAIALGKGGTDVHCVDCHGVQSEELHRPHHYTQVAFDNLGQQCDHCHEPDIITDHVDDRGWNCETCHGDARFQAAIAKGKGGDMVYCSDCHKAANASSDAPPEPATMAIVDGHWQPPDHAALGHVVMQSPCNTCHDPAGTADTVSGVHHDKCGLCHLAPPVLRTGLPAGGGSCRDCHGDTSFHHRTQYAQAGDCTYCHAPLGIGSGAPYQMACRECHVNSTSTELEIKKYDLSLASGEQPTPIDAGLTHKIPNTSPSGTPIQIYDYKVCFACHSGLNGGFPTAPVVTPFHGFPGDAKNGAATPVFNSARINDLGSNSNVANMLPRVVLYYHPGIETIRRFGATFGKKTGTSNYARYSSGTYYNATSLNADTGLTARGMARKTGVGQLFSGGEYINWRNPLNTSTGTGATYAVPASGYADRLASVPFTMFGAQNGPYTSIPYFKTTLPPPGPYGEKISVIKADWNPITKALIIWAINDGLGTVQVYADGVPMSWVESKGRWQYEITQPTYIPQVSLLSDDNGSAIASINNSKDQLVLVSAEWDQHSVGSELHVQVENTTSTMVWIDYATVVNSAMSNISGNNWSLSAAAANKPYQVRIHSNNYGELTAPVTDVTFNWPPQQAGTITDVTNASYWNRSGKNPDRLQAVVKVGTDGRAPKMRLNGSSQSAYVDIPCIYARPNYRCQIASNTLYNAGYDPYVVVYTGANPGEGSVLRYTINNWASDQIPLLPMTNLAPVAVDDSYVVDMGSGAQAFSVLANDTDGDGGTLSIVEVGAPSNGGIATINGTTITYTPASAYSGVEQFTYTISDGMDTASALVTVSVDNGIDDAPVAVNDTISGIIKGSSNNALNALANDYDPDPGDALTLLAVGAPSAGGQTTVDGGTIRYTPPAAFTGIEVFTYTIRDAGGHQDTASVMATVEVGPTDHTTFVTAATNCTRCHSGTAGTSTTVPVSTTDPLLHAACSTCHGDNYALKGLAAANNPATDASVVWMPSPPATTGGSCENCHGATYFANHKNIDHLARVVVAGKCIVCHAATGGTTAGAPVAPADPKVHDACSTCHNTTTGYLLTQAQASNPGTTATVTAMVGGECVDCHASYANGHHDTDHTAKVAATANCSGCHPATAGTAINVPLDQNDNKVHDECTTCHSATNGALREAYGKASSMPSGGGNCNACHGAYFVSHLNADHSNQVAGSAACSGCHDATAGTSSGVPVDGIPGNKVHDACSTCHDTTTGALRAAYGKASSMPAGGGSCIDCHGTYPEAHLHIHDVSHDPATDRAQPANTACRDCHDDAGLGVGVALSTWAAIKLEHDLDDTKDGVGSCATCHGYANADGGNSPPLATTETTIATGVDVKCLNCHTEKTSPVIHGGHPAIDFGWDAPCNNCHSGTSVVKNVHGNKCGLCHVDPVNADYSRRAGTNGNAVLAAALGTPRQATCLTCHPSATYLTEQIHHNSKMAANNNCGGCHGSVDHSGTVADVAACTTCHATAGSQHGAPISPAASTIHDSCRTCHTFDNNKRGILVNFSNQKGVTGSGSLPNGGTAAGKDGGGVCTSCHTGVSSAKTFHHANAHTLIGECEFCHADPRNRVGGTNFQETVSVPTPIPTHLPCEECHVTPKATAGWGGGQLTILAFNEGGTHSTSSYTSDFTRTTAHSGGHVIANTVGRINNWGICLGCHDGGKAVKVNVMHAKPTFSGLVNGCGSGGKAQFAPGRQVRNTMGNFNFFATTFRPASTKPSGGSCQSTSDWSGSGKYGTTDFTATDLVIPDPWSTSVQTIPMFAEQTPNTISSPAADAVQVKSAIYNGTAIVVTATSSGDCSALTAAYGAVTAPMGGTTTCTATLTPVTYPANGTTVDVTTSNAAGMNVLGYRISNQPAATTGVIAFSGINFTANENGSVATITVTRMEGATGAVSVHYATSNGTASAGVNYTATSGTLSWANGEVADKSFTIPLQDDAVYLGDLTVNLALSSVIGATLGMPSSAVLTIVDNELPSLLSFSAPTYAVSEAGTTATITVRRTGPTVGAVGVSYATSNGTALAAADYTATSGTLSWANGTSMDKSFTIPISDDNESEDDETVTITLSAATGPAVIGSPGAAVLTITDNDRISALNSWTHLYGASLSAKNGTSGTAIPTFTVSAGQKRLLLVAVALENGVGPQTATISATYGGVAMHPIALATGQVTHQWLGYLLDSEIPAGASNRVVVTYSAPTNNFSGYQVKWGTYSGVNQTTPINSVNDVAAATNDTTFGATIDSVKYGLTVVAGINGGSSSTMVVNGGTEFTTTAYNGSSGSLSASVAETAQHSASGNYASGTAVTFTGTTNWCAMVVVSLKP